MESNNSDNSNKDIDIIFRDLFDNITNRNPRKIYHYTDGHGLLGILHEGKIRATNIAYLNDSTEFNHSIKLLGTVERHFRKNCSGASEVFLDKLYDRLSKFNPKNPPGIYVACFSEAKDQLSQWRGYGGGHDAGYCFEFNGSKIKSRVARLNSARKEGIILLLPCLYGLEYQYSMLVDTFTKLIKIFNDRILDNKDRSEDELCNEIVDYILSNLFFLTPAFKDEAFHEEKEWRIILYTDQIDNNEFNVKKKYDKFLHSSIIV